MLPNNYLTDLAKLISTDAHVRNYLLKSSTPLPTNLIYQLHMEDIYLHATWACLIITYGLSSCLVVRIYSSAKVGLGSLFSLVS